MDCAGERQIVELSIMVAQEFLPVSLENLNLHQELEHS